MRDYITTAFNLVVGLLNSDKLVYLALIGLGLLVIWQLLSLLTSFNNKLAKKCRKISKFLSTRGLSAQNYNAFLALVAKMPQEFIRGYKTFEHASYGLPSDYIKRFDSIDVEVNGGVFNHGKSVQKWFIAVWSTLLFVLSLALMGEDATLTPYALADALVLPVLFWIVAKLFYYIFTAIRQQQYRVAVDEFNEMLDIMNDKIENNDDLPGPDVLADGYNEAENGDLVSPNYSQEQKTQPAPQVEKVVLNQSEQNAPKVVPAMSAITRAELAKVYGEVNAQMGQNFASTTSQVTAPAEEPATEGKKEEDTFSEEELAEPITDAETESVIDKEMQKQTSNDFWAVDNSASNKNSIDTQINKDKTDFWGFDEAPQPKSEPKEQPKKDFWGFDEVPQPKSKPKEQEQINSASIEDTTVKKEKPKFVWDILESATSTSLKDNEQTTSSQKVEEPIQVEPKNIDTAQNVEYNTSDVSQVETKNNNKQTDLEEENFVEQEENNEVKRGRGRPKKLPEGEVVITTDEQFEEALERAEKLMRKSEEALSASQAKRVEKSLKDLMDAMTKYKEEH